MTWIAIAAGTIAGLAAARLRLPGGPLPLALLASGAVTLLANEPRPAEPPQALGWAALALLGMGLGAGATRLTVQRVRRLGLLGPASVVVIVVAGLLTGVLLGRVSGIPIATALLGTAPGGSGEMAAAAFSVGASAEVVVVMQFVRQLLVMAVLPVVLSAGLAHVRARRNRATGPTDPVP